MILYDASDLESQILKNVLDIKNIEYTTEAVASECALADGDFLIDDVFTAIKYLDERHPKPSLFSTSPEQNARLNLLLTKILNGEYPELSKISELIFSKDYIIGDTISIADLALLPLISDTIAWKDYKTRIKNEINK